MSFRAMGYDSLHIFKRYATAAKRRNDKKQIIEIQIGDKTHTHSQSINPVSLSVIKTIVRSPVKPIPL